MAMITCPECGQEISDKSKKCVHCGKVFVEEAVNEEIKCEECGATLSENDSVCPNCGCPVEVKGADNIRPQKVEVTNIELTKKTKKIIIGIVVIIILGAFAGVGYKFYSDAKAEQEYQNSYNEYIDNLEMAQLQMLSGGSDAESLCNLTLRVWGNSIYEEEDEETDKYTRPDGYWLSDFNDALANLYLDSSTEETISSIESNQTSVKELIKKLQNPPDGLDNCYDTVSDLYDAYKILTDLAISPSGNYTGFSTNKSDAVSDFMSAYEKLDNQIPDKLEE